MNGIGFIAMCSGSGIVYIVGVIFAPFKAAFEFDGGFIAPNAKPPSRISWRSLVDGLSIEDWWDYGICPRFCFNRAPQNMAISAG